MKNTITTTGISFFLNGRKVSVEVPPYQTALELIRDELGLTGTKEGCSEGDCGICTIAVGAKENEQFIYRAVNSCLFPAIRLHGKQVVTIEGLSYDEKLHLIQKAVLENHATQCGFCTPGIIMSLFCVFANEVLPDELKIINALEGNLCRCTGYESIRRAEQRVSQILAKEQIDRKLIVPPNILTSENNVKTFEENLLLRESENREYRQTLEYLIPNTLNELFGILDEYQDGSPVRIIAGGTDLFVDLNVKREFPETLVDVSAIPGLDLIVEKDSLISIGANVTLSQILENEIVRNKLPGLHNAISLMGSQQIRNVATLAGNIANASPIADGAVALLGLDASVHLVSKRGTREVRLEDFYLGYKKTVLQKDEIIQSIEIPLTQNKCFFEKSSKRYSVDIAAVSSFMNISINGNCVEKCRIAFGGVAEYPKLAKKCYEFLISKKLNEENFQTAAQIAETEFNTISDIRGSADYRRILIRNHILKHFNRLMGLE